MSITWFDSRRVTYTHIPKCVCVWICDSIWLAQGSFTCTLIRIECKAFIHIRQSTLPPLRLLRWKSVRTKFECAEHSFLSSSILFCCHFFLFKNRCDAVRCKPAVQLCWMPNAFYRWKCREKITLSTFWHFINSVCFDSTLAVFDVLIWFGILGISLTNRWSWRCEWIFLHHHPKWNG